jgi:hypothetical protein
VKINCPGKIAADGERDRVRAALERWSAKSLVFFPSDLGFEFLDVFPVPAQHGLAVAA